MFYPGRLRKIAKPEPYQGVTSRLVHLLPKSELLNGETFYSLKEAQILIEAWRRHYNAICPPSALGWRPPAPQVRVAAPLTWTARGPLNRMAENATIH